jgi:imidazolonepropionase-like amidohydrolase
MSQILLENARLFDGVNAECPEGISVLIDAGSIREVSDKPITCKDAQRIDVAGKTLMPGMIDLHIHAYIADVNVAVAEQAGAAFRTAHAIRMRWTAVSPRSATSAVGIGACRKHCAPGSCAARASSTPGASCR